MAAAVGVRLAVASASAGLLGLLTGLVASGLPPVGWDRRLDRRLVVLDAFHPWVPRLAQPVTVLADPRVDAAVCAVVLLVAARRRRCYGPPVRLAVLLSLVVLLKAGVGRPGPQVPLPHGLGWFPSGHTATAAGCAWLLAGLASARLRRPVRVLAVCWPLLVAVCMVVHRYHWASDVVGALLLAAAVVLFPARPRGVRRPGVQAAACPPSAAPP